MAKRRRRGRKSHGRRHHRRRHYRRNPGMVRGLMGQIKGAAGPVMWGTVGFIGTAALPNIAARFVPIPDKATSPVIHYAVRAAAAVATGFAVGMFAGKQNGQAAMVGGGIAIVADLAMPLIAGPLGLATYLPDEGVQAYLDDNGNIGYLNPGMDVQNEGIAGSELPDRLNPDNRF
jgi:hypothetical protein